MIAPNEHLAGRVKKAPGDKLRSFTLYWPWDAVVCALSECTNPNPGLAAPSLQSYTSDSKLSQPPSPMMFGFAKRICGVK
jgi:hypothetical protein